MEERFGNQDSREVTLNISQLTALPWHTAAEAKRKTEQFESTMK